MNKNEFLSTLCDRLSGLPKEDVEKTIEYYSEIIDDRIEDGLSEEEAVNAVGSIDDIVAQTLTGASLPKLVKAKVNKSRTLKAWEIVLLILGSPVWLSLLIAAFAVILSLYISLWSVIISLWAVFGSVISCAFGVTIAGFVFAFGGNGLAGAAMIGAGVVCAGLSIFMFYGCKAATKGILILTKKLVLWIKNCFIKKEEA